MKAEPATQTLPRFVMSKDGVLRTPAAPADGPPETVKQLGDRVLWLLGKRGFGNPNRSNSTGVNALDVKIGAAIGYTTRLVQNRFVSIDPQRVAKIAEVLDTNLEWLVTGRGPWQRSPDHEELSDDARARWEAIRFAKVCGFSRASIRFAETLHWKKRGPAPNAEEWFEIIRLREQQIRAGLLEGDEEDAPPSEPVPLEAGEHTYVSEPDPAFADFLDAIEADPALIHVDNDDHDDSAT
ncbi:MAG TPA: hypothetical protein VGM56_00465 [Byssovorax sp.]|jgi:hypothetical protein